MCLSCSSESMSLCDEYHAEKQACQWEQTTEGEVSQYNLHWIEEGNITKGAAKMYRKMELNEIINRKFERLWD